MQPWSNLFALRVLCGIATHIFPLTVYPLGLNEENKTKPAITHKIESKGEGLTAEQAAHGLFKSVENGEFHISDSISHETTVNRSNTLS